MSSMAVKAKSQHRRHHSTTIASPKTNNAVSVLDTMFHGCQESTMLMNEFHRRNLNCFEQKRQAEYSRCQGLKLKHVMASTGKAPITSLQRQSLPSKIRLTMEVQSTDFSSLHDGREAWTVNDSLAQIMEDTGCVLNFADKSAENAENVGIYNQVTIIGDMPNVDIAMNRIRAFCPITLAIPLTNIKDDLKDKDIANMIRLWSKSEQLSDYSKIQFSILCAPNPFASAQGTADEKKCPSLVIRASRNDYGLMNAACEAITKLIFKKRPNFFAYLKIPISQRRMFAGSPEGVQIKSISSQTRAMFQFPSSSDKSAGNNNYFITGSTADAVIKAVRIIQDIGPLRIEFEVENEHLARPLDNNEEHRELDQFDIERAVIVQLRKSPYEGNFRLKHEDMRHSLTLMTSEENVHNLYKVRQQLLLEKCWKHEAATKSKKEARYVEFLKVLVMESSMRAYIGEGKLISVCRCRNHHQPIANENGATDPTTPNQNGPITNGHAANNDNKALLLNNAVLNGHSK